MKAWPEFWPPETEPIVALLPHPDDEIFCAGLLATAASAEARVGLIVATRGERGRLFGAVASEEEVAAVRRRELEASCTALGLPPPRVLALPDGGLDAASAEHIRVVTEAVADSAPQLLVTFAEDGGYGHRDHVALARIAAGLPYRALCMQFSAGLFDELRAAIRRSYPDLLTPADPAAHAIEYELPISRRLAAVKRAAISAHASQLDRQGHFLSPKIERAILERELYVE